MANSSTPSESFTAKLIFNGQSLNITYQITGKYAFLNKCYPTISNKPVLHLDVDVITPLVEDNLLLLKLPDEHYTLLSSEQFRERLVKDRTTYLSAETLVSCPYDLDFTHEIVMTYTQIPMTNLPFHIDAFNLDYLIMDLTKRRILECRKLRNPEEKVITNVEEKAITNAEEKAITNVEESSRLVTIIESILTPINNYFVFVGYFLVLQVLWYMLVEYFKFNPLF